MTGRIEMVTYNLVAIIGTREGQWMRFSVPSRWLTRVSAENGWRVKETGEEYDLTEAHKIALAAQDGGVLSLIEVAYHR